MARSHLVHPAARIRASAPVLFVLAVLATLALHAPATADPLSIDRWTVDGGGTSASAAGSFVLGGTSGQPDAGLVSRLGFAVVVGFWAPGTAALLAVDPPGGDPGTPPQTTPIALRVFPAAPNPLRDATSVALDLPEPARVQVEVFDLRGALLATVADALLPAGRHAFDWCAANAAGRRVGPGLYVMRVRTAGLESVQKIVVLR